MNRKQTISRQKNIQDPLPTHQHRRNHLYAQHYETSAVQKHTILYESRVGQSITGNPYAIFKYLLNHPDFSHYRHIWAIRDSEALKDSIEEYRDYENVRSVEQHTKEYVQALATSKYLINNSAFMPFYIPRDEQVYINTWHGTPLKTLGFKIPGDPSISNNVLRDFMSADYLLSPNPHTTEVLMDNYKLDGIYSGTIIEDGYPRIDLTITSNVARMKQWLKRAGLQIDESKKFMLYAPTWKGTTDGSTIQNDMAVIISDMEQLISRVGDQYNVLIKVHPFFYKIAKDYEEIHPILVPDTTDTNELLGLVDVLITDYSSLFFDFLVTGKPILFYMWDVEEYAKERGSYFEFDELPGPIAYTISELIETVQYIDKVFLKHQDKYKSFQKRFVPYDDGKVTERAVDYIFRHKKVSLRTIQGLDKQKEKIVLYPGNMMNSDQTSSFLHLLHNIDYDQHDVSCLLDTITNKEALNNIEKISEHVRLLFRNDLPVYTESDIRRDAMIQNYGIPFSSTPKFYPEKAYQREFRRFFGKSQFDIAIDFSGAEYFWAKLLLASGAEEKICYIHRGILFKNDRMTNSASSRAHRLDHNGLFSIYNRFDKLVSLSTKEMEQNKKSFRHYASRHKFDYVMNSIYLEKILQRQE